MARPRVSTASPGGPRNAEEHTITAEAAAITLHTCDEVTWRHVCAAKQTHPVPQGRRSRPAKQPETRSLFSIAVVCQKGKGAGAARGVQPFLHHSSAVHGQMLESSSEQDHSMSRGHARLLWLTSAHIAIAAALFMDLHSSSAGHCAHSVWQVHG